jgi:hypothetical protein
MAALRGARSLERGLAWCGEGAGDVDLDAGGGWVEDWDVSGAGISGAVSANSRLEVCASCSGIEAVAFFGGRVSWTWGSGGGCTGCAIDVSGTEAFRGIA